jgi:hypothetical protein
MTTTTKATAKNDTTTAKATAKKRKAAMTGKATKPAASKKTKPALSGKATKKWDAAAKKTAKATKKPAKKTTTAKKVKKTTKASSNGEKVTGTVRSHDLAWGTRKVAIFKALKSLRATGVTTARSAKDVAAKAEVTTKDVRHYSYHAASVGLIGLCEREDIRGYGFYLTAKGAKIKAKVEK